VKSRNVGSTLCPIKGVALYLWNRDNGGSSSLRNREQRNNEIKSAIFHAPIVNRSEIACAFCGSGAFASNNSIIFRDEYLSFSHSQWMESAATLYREKGSYAACNTRINRGRTDRNITTIINITAAARARIRIRLGLLPRPLARRK